MYDGIILAAGKNTRLKGIIPSYHKPMLLVNGRPLILTITQHLLERCERVVLVVSPENCGPITELLIAADLTSDRVHIVIQPEAKGPGEAILRALLVCKSERVLIALGDNVIPVQDFDNVVEADFNAVQENPNHACNHITISFVPVEDDAEAERFTRILGTEFIEGSPGGKFQDMYRCWTGPLIADLQTLENALLQLHRKSAVTGLETKISPALNYIEHRTVSPVQGGSVDIGTSDALLQLNQEIKN